MEQILRQTIRAIHDAKFKETDLKNLIIGDAIKCILEMYQSYDGTNVSVTMRLEPLLTTEEYEEYGAIPDNELHVTGYDINTRSNYDIHTLSHPGAWRNYILENLESRLTFLQEHKLAQVINQVMLREPYSEKNNE